MLLSARCPLMVGETTGGFHDWPRTAFFEQPGTRMASLPQPVHLLHSRLERGGVPAGCLIPLHPFMKSTACIP
jgi:hypothetical protein